jgi:hypothetical protein
MASAAPLLALLILCSPTAAQAQPARPPSNSVDQGAGSALPAASTNPLAATNEIARRGSDDSGDAGGGGDGGGDAGGGGDGGGDAPRTSKPAAQARGALSAATRSTAAARSALSRSATDRGDALQLSLAEAQSAIATAELRQREVAIRLKELQTVGAEVERERNELEKAKSALEAREKILSMGVYASLTAFAVALLTLLARWPMDRLERQLKRLEIRAKEFDLQERGRRLRSDA